MNRSDHILAVAIGLLLVAGSCLGMLASHCPDCGFHWLSSLAVGAMGTAIGVGVAVFAVACWRTRCLWRLCRSRAIPHPAKLWHVCQRSSLATDRIVCTAQAEPLAFCIGLLRPRVVVSTGLVEQVSSSELAAILAHERRHQQRRDPLRFLVVTLLRSMLYPLPIIHDLSRTFLTLLEIEADEAAIACSGRPALASALHKLLTLSAPYGVSPRLAAITPFSVQSGRLEHLLDPHPIPPLSFSPPRLAVSLIPFLLLCLTMALH
jgi:Zn-dependent protease with chaperone function